jgi:hypothetical protein
MHDADVRDAADVECHSRLGAVAEEQLVDVGDQGGAAASGGDVAFTEVGDGADSGAFGDDGRVADLSWQCGPRY